MTNYIPRRTRQCIEGEMWTEDAVDWLLEAVYTQVDTATMFFWGTLIHYKDFMKAKRGSL